MIKIKLEDVIPLLSYVGSGDETEVRLGAKYLGLLSHFPNKPSFVEKYFTYHEIPFFEECTSVAVNVSGVSSDIFVCPLN